jgi:hypothetical protein
MFISLLFYKFSTFLDRKVEFESKILIFSNTIAEFSIAVLIPVSASSIYEREAFKILLE